MYILWKSLIITTSLIVSTAILPSSAMAPSAEKVDIVLQKVIDCESGGDPKAYNPKDKDGRPKYGLLQYDEKTFYAWAEKAKIIDANIWDPDQQIEVYHYAARNGLLRSWGCFAQLFPR